MAFASHYSLVLIPPLALPQIDLRKSNSWILPLESISTTEAAEVFVINSLAPFILNSKLKPLLLKSPHRHRFIINVSAMEGNNQFVDLPPLPTPLSHSSAPLAPGKFYRNKTPNHPHTNMAKAALNMMTRTSSGGYAKQRIFMNSVRAKESY